MKKLRIVAVAALVVFPLVAAAQTPAQTDDLQRQINTLNETNRLILKELQEIRKVLERQPVAAAPQQAAADPLPTEPMDVSRDPFKGAANAKVAVIEFSDYQCPFCGRFEKDQYVQILRDYVDTGKVKYVWRDMPLDMHPNAQKAAEAGHCAGAQGKFWEMHDRLFTNQQALAAADLTKHAEALQLNVGQFQSCLDSGRFAADIKADMTDAGKAGISGTPSFLFGLVQPNGTVKIVKRIVGTKPYAEFKSAIDSALGSAPTAGTR
jgi:protein-disulfide isomerase